jgi:hypothetical protein
MSSIEFKAPGPGSWELEQTHFAKPATRYASAIVSDPLARGFGEGTKRYGLLLDTLRMRFVNDFAYGKFVPVGAPDNAVGPPPRPIFMLLTRLHPEIRRRTAAAPEVFSQKLWREDMRRWDEEIKPDSIKRNSALQNTPLATLDDGAFLAYLETIRANAVEMIYRHHIFTISCCFPVGHFVSEVQRWTNLPSGEVLGALKGAAPISRGVGVEPLARLRDALASGGVTVASVRGRPAQQVLDELLSKEGIAAPLQAYLDQVGYRAVSGYDICDQYALEMPEMLVSAIFGAADKADRRADFVGRRDALRAKVPAAHRAEFDELLEEARFIHRLRDERGMYNDAWGTGLARRAMLEAGRPRRRSLSARVTTRSLGCSEARQSRASKSCGAASTGGRPRPSRTRRRFSDQSRRLRRRSAGCRRRRSATHVRSMRQFARFSTFPRSRCSPNRWRASPCIPASTRGRPGSSTALKTSTGCSPAMCSSPATRVRPSTWSCRSSARSSPIAGDSSRTRRSSPANTASRPSSGRTPRPRRSPTERG